MMSLLYSTLIVHSYRDEVPVSSWVATGMKAGVTWLRRALKRPSKSVKYLEAASSTTFNLAPPLPERAHVEDEVSEAGIVHKPFASRIDYPPHLLVMPLSHLVSDEQWLVVTEKLRYTITRHSAKGLHDKLLNWIRDGLVPENDRAHRFFRVTVDMLELKS